MRIVSNTSDSAPQTITTSRWLSFWFCDAPGGASLFAIRAGLSLIACWYFASHSADAGTWFSGTGLLATERLGDFLDSGDLTDEAKWRISPLYLTSSTVVVRIYLTLGILLAIAAMTIRTSRAPAILLWLWCLWLANRSLLIAGPEELALVFGLAYLTIPRPNDATHWTHVLARRLLQVHLTLLLAATGLTMLSSEIWWDGTGAVSIAAPIGRRSIDLTDLLASPWIHEPLTHAVVIVPIAAAIMIWCQPTRKIAYFSLMLWCVALALLSSQWMYLATMAVLLQCFKPNHAK